MFAFVGHNGADKTTLIQLLMNILHPSSGSATVLGQPSTTLTGGPERRLMHSLDFQEFHKQTAINEFPAVSEPAPLFKKVARTRLMKILADSTTSRVSYTLDSSIDSVNKMEQTAELVALRAGFDEDTVGNISMAVREAAVNAVLHGNAYDANKTVTATFETTADALIIRISDQGGGLDPDTIPDPLAPENILRGSGRGIFLIRAFMDEVKFRQLHPGTELTLIKHRMPAQARS